MQHTFTLTNPNFKDECAKQHCFMLSLYLWSHLDALNWNIKSNLEIRVTWDCPKKTWSSVIFLHFDVFYHIPPGIEYVRFSPKCVGYFYYEKKKENLIFWLRQYFQHSGTITCFERLNTVKSDHSSTECSLALHIDVSWSFLSSVSSLRNKRAFKQVFTDMTRKQTCSPKVTPQIPCTQLVMEVY